VARLRLETNIDESSEVLYRAMPLEVLYQGMPLGIPTNGRKNSRLQALLTPNPMWGQPPSAVHSSTSFWAPQLWGGAAVHRCDPTPFYNVVASAPDSLLFAFRNKNHFPVALLQMNATLNPTEGDQCIRRPARAAAVPDTWRRLPTCSASRKASHLSR